MVRCNITFSRLFLRKLTKIFHKLMTGHWCFVSVKILDVGMDCIRHYVIFYFKIFLLPNCQRVYFIWSLAEAKRRLIKKETFRLHTHTKKNLKCFITSHRPSNYIYNFWITKTTFRILTSTKFPAVLTQKQFQYKNSLLLLLLFAIWKIYRRRSYFPMYCIYVKRTLCFNILNTLYERTWCILMNSISKVSALYT